MPSRKTNPEFMTGVPELLILRLLTEREMYGYEIVQAIEAATEVLTQALHKMSEQVYQRAAAEQQTADGGDETVEDADYEVIDEDDTADKA